MLSIDTEKLLQLIKSFYVITGIKIAIYDTDFSEIFAYPTEHSELCSMIQCDTKLCRYCEKSTKSILKKCTEQNKLIIMKCHAGMTEAAAPLTENGVTLGYIMYGQITNEKDRINFTADVITRCERYGLDKAALLKNTAKIRYYSDEQLEATSQILNTLTTYIILNHLVYLKEKPLMHTIMDYINSNLSDDLSVAAICRKFSVSKSLLYRISKPYMKNGIAEFVKSARINSAATLLRTTDVPIWQIAVKTGFNDYNYFQRIFKKEKGVSAEKYRKTV